MSYIYSISSVSVLKHSASLLKTPCILVSHISNFSCLSVSEPFPSNGIGSFALCFLSQGSVRKGGLVSGFILWLVMVWVSMVIWELGSVWYQHMLRPVACI